MEFVIYYPRTGERYEDTIRELIVYIPGYADKLMPNGSTRVIVPKDFPWGFRTRYKKGYKDLVLMIPILDPNKEGGSTLIEYGELVYLNDKDERIVLNGPVDVNITLLKLLELQNLEGR